MNEAFVPVNSELVVKSSGSLSIEQDLNTQEGKSIAQLIYDTEKTETAEQRK